jgi:hypothetical protein
MGLQAPAADVWSLPLGNTGLYANLVIDAPERMCYVPSRLVEESGRPGEEWLRVALDNLRARSDADCLTVVDEESGIRLCSMGDSYDSSRALVLDALWPEESEDGFFVAVPARDHLLALAVGAPALAVVPTLKVYAEKQFQAAPYPLSPEVFWVRHGAWHVFPVVVRGEHVLVDPPEAFVEVLQRLLPQGPCEELPEEGG